jgi:hypothetical protein
MAALGGDCKSSGTWVGTSSVSSAAGAEDGGYLAFVQASTGKGTCRRSAVELWLVFQWILVGEEGAAVRNADPAYGEE